MTSTNDNTEPCHRCLGCGQLANSDDREPWTTWQDLPPGSDLAVRLGLVRPVPCDICGGSGKTPAATAHELEFVLTWHPDVGQPQEIPLGQAIDGRDSTRGRFELSTRPVDHAMSWVGWRCTRCRHEMRNNPRFCPVCTYTVYEPVHDHERPEWRPEGGSPDGDAE